MINAQPWHKQCPVEVEKFIHMLEVVENYLRPRMQTPNQRNLVGQLAYVRQHLPDFSDQPLPCRRYTGEWRKEIRRRVLQRDNNTCQNCQRNDLDPTVLQVHHIQPLSQGGSNHITNLTTLCPVCHEAAHAESQPEPTA